MLHMVYTDDCPWCVLAKELLNKHDIEYRTVKVTQDNVEHFRAIGIKTVPHVTIGPPESPSRVIGGYEKVVEYVGTDAN